MATTRIISMHVTNGGTVAGCLSDRTAYSMNPEKTNGGELSIKAVPVPGLNITAGVSYTDAKVYNFPTDVTEQVVRTVRPSFTPKWRSNLDARYSHSFHNGTLTWDANWTYRSEMFFSLRNFSAAVICAAIMPFASHEPRP